MTLQISYTKGFCKAFRASYTHFGLFPTDIGVPYKDPIEMVLFTAPSEYGLHTQIHTHIYMSWSSFPSDMWVLYKALTERGFAKPKGAL